MPTAPADHATPPGADQATPAAPATATEPVADKHATAAVQAHSKVTAATELPLADLNVIDAPAATADTAATAATADSADPVATECSVKVSAEVQAEAAEGEAPADATAAVGAASTAAVPPRVPDLSPAACAELLKRHFPALFTGPPKPLKLRIQQDIQQRTPGVFSKGSLGAFFRRYTGSTGYLIALGKASQRFDLDGQPAGDLSEEHRGLARDELARRRQLGRERDQLVQAQQQAVQAQQQAEQQAVQAELLQARQARLALLRDFERTTLTLANFCALKGLTPETLTPQLEQAKREVAEAPPPRPFDDRSGPPGPRRDDRNGPRPEGRRDARPPAAAHGEGQADNRGNAGGDARGDNRREPRSDPRAAPRAEGRPDNRPQAPRSTGRPGGRPGGR